MSMRRKMRLIRWLGLLVVVAACAVGYGSTKAESGANKSPVLIGAFVYTQGSLKAFGDETAGGIKLAVDEANKRGGILGGRKIKLKIYEEGLNADTTTQSVRRAKSDGAVGIVGFLDATEATTAAAVSKRLGLPIVIAGAGAGSFVKNNTRKDLVHVLTYVEALYPALDAWIKKQGAKRVVQIGYDSTYTRVAEKVHRANLKGLNFPATIYIPYGQSDVGAAVSKAMSYNPDAVLFDIWGDASVGAIKRMHELGFRGRSIQATVSMADAFMKAAGPAACGMKFMDTEYFYPSKAVPQSQQFMKRLKAFGATLGGQTEPFYEGTKILIQALDKAGTTSDQKKIGEAMHKVNFMTPRGAKMEILKNGQVYLPSWDIVKWDCATNARKVIGKLKMGKSNFADSKIIG
jgi:branched-chain amino acid transport system substrate-binding protein